MFQAKMCRYHDIIPPVLILPLFKDEVGTYNFYIEKKYLYSTLSTFLIGLFDGFYIL